MERDKRMTDTEKAALERRIYDRCLVRVGQLEAEKAALERRIDELCQENEQMRKTAAMLANARTTLLAENAKLREFAAQMANALGIDSEWCDPEWCDSACMDEFKCRPTGDNGETRCPAFARMAELGIEVPS